MHDLIQRLSQLSAAEEFLDFFGVAYEQTVVNVNRLHILKRFQQYLRNAADPAEEDPVRTYRRYRELLARAYEDFVHSSAQREKVFKVFQQAGGTRHVPAESLRASLEERRASGPQSAEGA